MQVNRPTPTGHAYDNKQGSSPAPPSAKQQPKLYTPVPPPPMPKAKTLASTQQSSEGNKNEGSTDPKAGTAPTRTPMPMPGTREIELSGKKYQVADKPDAGDGEHYLLREQDPNDPTKLVSTGKIAKPDEHGVWHPRGVKGGGRLSQLFSSRYRDAREELRSVISKYEKAKSAPDEAEVRDFTTKMTDLAEKGNAEHFEKIDDYIHADSDFVNKPLRAGQSTPELDEFLREFNQLENYDGKAYRSAFVTPDGARKIRNGVGEVFRDAGVQSASVTVRNAASWEGWAEDVAQGRKGATQRVMYTFDEEFSKKNLSSRLLKDHVAIAPGQPMKILAVEEHGNILFVYISSPSKVPDNLYNIFDGTKIY